MHKPTWLLTFFFIFLSSAYALPSGFVYLHDVEPTILQDIRYAGYHNFVGRPIKGYDAATCILTKPAAQALKKVQQALLQSSLSLKVYDCYRPAAASADFLAWSQEPQKTETKAEFYPNVDKANLFRLNYVAEKSGHNRGSTVDLTIVPVPAMQQAAYYPGQKLVACTAPYSKRFRDNSIDMGTGYDCMDERSHAFNTAIDTVAASNRLMLRNTMIKYGFVPYEEEWWHFNLKDEPYPDFYFNFAIKW